MEYALGNTYKFTCMLFINSFIHVLIFFFFTFKNK